MKSVTEDNGVEIEHITRETMRSSITKREKKLLVEYDVKFLQDVVFRDEARNRMGRVGFK